MEFMIIMNQYMLHSQFIEEERSFMHKDKFVSILERMLEQGWFEENERLKEEEETRQRRIKLKKSWKNLTLINRNLNLRITLDKLGAKRNSVRITR
jgi:ribosomal protein S8